MILIRHLEEKDREILDKSIEQDEFHKGLITSDFFYAPGTYTEVYEIDGKPIVYVRSTKSLRIDAHYMDCENKQNALVMIEKIDELVERAKQSGFTEIYCNTSSQKLADFMAKYLGFIEIKDKKVLRRLI